MKKVALGILIGFCLPLFGGFVFLLLGGIPIATKGPALPLERYIAKTAIHVAIGDEENRPSPISAEEINLLAGAKVYMNHCAVCHGSSGGHPSFIAKGLFPKPPQLLEPDDQINDDPIGEAYWKIKNGIRLTGMPGFEGSLSDTEMWQLSQLLVNANKLSDSVKGNLK